jgi:methylmalonyl-CoA/ethylmalonyl-CoA epimerase
VDSIDAVGGKTAGFTNKDLIGIDHIAIAVENLDEAVDWYVNGFGFRLEEKRTTTGLHTAMLSAVLTAGNIVVVLVQGTSERSQVSRFISRYGAGVQHIAFRVANIGQVISRLIYSGAAADTTLIEGEGIRQLFLRRDRGSGVRIELIERNGGTFSDKTVGQLFKEFEERDLV